MTTEEAALMGQFRDMLAYLVLRDGGSIVMPSEDSIRQALEGCWVCCEKTPSGKIVLTLRTGKKEGLDQIGL